MSKLIASAEVSARAAEAAHFTSVPAFDPRRRNAPLAQRSGVVRHRPVGGHAKRAIDVALVLLALLLLAPMFLLVALLLRVNLGWSILVAERNVGFGGRIFTAYTFRTSSPHGARELSGDPIIPTCLAFLRHSGVDRLPQLFNILSGDMSFVGPRPVTLGEINREGHCAPDYFAARPGLVGLRRLDRVAINCSRRSGALNRYYVRHWSVWLDLALLASAVASVGNLAD
jgi:exopolysaccharide production protein ExoY